MGNKSKKAMELPINVIIVAALALVVLVVMIIIFTGQTKKTAFAFESCNTIGGRCAASCDTNTEVEKFNVKCEQTTQKCCIKVFDEKK